MAGVHKTDRQTVKILAQQDAPYKYEVEMVLRLNAPDLETAVQRADRVARVITNKMRGAWMVRKKW